MFRLIISTCLLQLCVGNIIRGQVLVDGDVNKSIRIPSGSKMTISIQDTTMADAAAIIIKQTQVDDLFSLPYAFEMEIPNDLSSQRIYTLSVRISKGTNLLFITDQHVRVPISSDSTITKDIPVVSINSDPLEADTRMLFNDAKKTAWPEMVGKEGSYVVEHIKEQTGFTQVFTVPRNSPMTMDFRNDRVRVAVDEKGIVSETPRIA